MTPSLGAGTLLIGCGYLGAAMVRALAPGTVTALTRGASRHADLAARGVRCWTCDLSAPDLAARLAPALADFEGVACVIAPPSAWSDEDLRPALARLTASLRTPRVTRAVLASSTAVYGDAHGQWVGAASPAQDADARTRKLLAIEQAWMDAGLDSYVVRLAGLYGPGRVIGRDGIARGESLPGDGDEWLNLLHIDDAARAMLATARGAAPLRYALISDATPVLRKDYYQALAAALGAPAPRFGAPGGRRAGSRRCDSASSWAALGLDPQWPDSRAALRALLASEG
ncbi:MAG: NAD-dependent epimerase/dehydratase family protein [Proteobacteria bacterium]|nr:NAD-dependent epimerase/dehydratase family protein [Pseudomonadota bacterium]